jgi:ubiquinone biosynthesis accessory factor UbiJ
MLPDLPVFFVNRLLGAQPWATRLLQRHVGQTARLDVGGAQFRVTVLPDGQIKTAAAEEKESVVIIIPAAALACLLDSPEEVIRHTHIEGSAAFADTLGDLLHHLRPDIAAWLAPHLGDVLAVRSANQLHRLGKTTLVFAQHAEEIFGHILHHTPGSLPVHMELQNFQQELGTLANDLETLTARLNALQRRI